ncbi:MAG: ROK family protein [Bacilli bacterium]|jgi:glucokinase|nr:ROK family protein [Bacilli bacterium]
MKIIGVDIGGTSIKSAIVDEEGQLLVRFSFRIDPRKSGEETLLELGKLINKTLLDNALSPKDISGIGIGCPGSINSTTGYCDYSNNLRWENLPVVAIVEKLTSIPSKVMNDANAAILGEVRLGAAKGYHSVVMLTLGTGVGGGLYLNDRLYEGNESKGAELGHSLLVMDGRECTCGRFGCLEAYASVSALIKDTLGAMRKDPKSAMWGYVGGDIAKVSGFTAFECAKKGDPSAQKVVDQYIRFLGEGCLNFINVFRPDAIVLGGGLSGQKEALTKPLVAYVASQGFGFGGSHSPKVDIVVSSLGNDAGILGAAALWMKV